MLPYHPIHLCQPDNRKSCGACCGLYNWKDHSRTALETIVQLQTSLLPEFIDSENFDAYRHVRNRQINNEKLFETIYNCEFLGFIDTDHRNLGCLLHPEVTGRKDLRDHCFYGSEICSGHFCPGYSCLTTVEQRAVVQAVDDWYLYGLVITDIDLVKEFFRHIENTMGDSIKETRLDHPGLREVLGDYFRLKEQWKFKARENRLGKYYFSHAEYAIARIDYTEKWGAPQSRFDKILVSLESDFSSYNDLCEAESIIENIMKRFIERYVSG